MYFGYGPFARYGFIDAGFGVVIVVGIAFALVYAVGATRGKRAARMWVDACVLGFVLGAVADTLFAAFSGQWRSFVIAFGVLPLLGLIALAVLFLGTMWLMAIRYTDGLKDD
jgi:hypothetical protein